MYVKKFITEGLDLSKPIFFDTETIGLYGRTRLVQVRQGPIAYEYDCYYINIEEIKYFFKNAHLVIHNAHYDLSCMDFKRWLPTKIDDTLIMARICYPFLDSHSLGALSEYLSLGEKTKEGASDWSKYNLTEEQLKYASMDTFLLEELYNVLINEMPKKTPYYKLDIENLRYSCVYEHKGMPIDKKQIRLFKKELLKELKTIDLPEDLNVNSPKQVTNYLGIESSSKASLLNIGVEEEKEDLAKKVLEKRRISKALSYLEDLEKHDCVYSILNPAGAKTGRFTSTGCDTMEGYYNLQQIPRSLKKVFGNSGGYFVTADYPALEVWICGAIIADPFLVSVLKNKDDLHYRAAEMMFNKPREEISKFERRVAKMCNFTLMYGAGYKMLGQAFINDGVPEVEPRAKTLREDWLRTYPEIARVQQEVFKYFQENSYKIVYTALGRPMCARKPTEALNFSIQGSGAECTKLALYLIHKEGIIPVNTVHDSIALIASTEKEAQEYEEILKWSMEESYRRVIANCKENSLSLNVEIYIGENYD